MSKKIIFALTLILLLSTSVAFAAVQLPNESDFDSGKVLKSSSLKSLVNYVADMSSRINVIKNFTNPYDGKPALGLLGNLFIQNIGTGATVVVDRTDAKIGNFRAGANGVFIGYDETGVFSISRASRDDILNGRGDNKVDVLIADQAGNVGIGMLPTVKFNVNGVALAQAWNITSDVRLKKNIYQITGALKKINKIRGVFFDWKKDNKHSVGVVAQEVEDVLPEVVTTGLDGYKSVDYGKLTPLLIEAIKELKQKNDILEKRIKTIEQTQNLYQLTNPW